MYRSTPNLSAVAVTIKVSGFKSSRRTSVGTFHVIEVSLSGESIPIPWRIGLFEPVEYARAKWVSQDPQIKLYSIDTHPTQRLLFYSD